MDFIAPLTTERTHDHYGAMFGSDAAEYDDRYNVDTEHGHWVLRRLLELRPRTRGPLEGTVLEIGAGTGQLTSALLNAEFGAHERLIVTDLAHEMLHVNHRAMSPGANVLYARCNVRDLPAADGSVDVVIGFDILHHVLDYELALAEIHRVLKPGGFCAVKEPHRDAYRMTAFLSGAFLAMDRHWNPWRGLTKNDRRLLVGWRDHIFSRLSVCERGDLETLAQWDDKYLFARDDLDDAAARLGFSEFDECNVLRRQRISMTEPQEPYAAMYLDWLTSIGISSRGIAWIEPVLHDLDLCIGDAVLAHWPMNTVFLFWR